jgi:hypothetical protein
MRPGPVALSLRQPWAWMVVHGGKLIENRRWSTNFRGEFFIHAAKGMTRREYEDAVAFAEVVDPALVVPRFENLDRGCIMGRARLVNVLARCTPPLAEHTTLGAPFDDATCEHRWHMPRQFGFVLEDIEPITPQPLSGALGFFHVPDTVHR